MGTVSKKGVIARLSTLSTAWTLGAVLVSKVPQRKSGGGSSLGWKCCG